MNIVLEEADETLFWLEILKERSKTNEINIEKALIEANELVAIFVTILKNTKNRILNKDISQVK